MLGKLSSAGRTAGAFVATPGGAYLLVIILLVLPFLVIGAGITGLLCCIFAPNLIFMAGLIILILILLILRPLPVQILIIIIVILGILAYIAFSNPDWIGLAIGGA